MSPSLPSNLVGPGSKKSLQDPAQTMQKKPLVPCGHDAQGPRGDSSLNTNQGPKPNLGAGNKVGRSQGATLQPDKEGERK